MTQLNKKSNLTSFLYRTLAVEVRPIDSTNQFNRTHSVDNQQAYC